MALIAFAAFRLSLDVMHHGTVLGGVGLGEPGRPAQDCARIPHRCGFPDATNTGARDPTQLKKVPEQVRSGPGWHYDARGFVVVNGARAVVSGLSISCGIAVTASGVTIRDVQVVTGGQNSVGISLIHADGVTIEDSTITGLNTGSGRIYAGIKDVYGDTTRTRILDNNISQASTGVQIYQGLVEGNYIHHPGMIPTDHVNGVTTNGDTRPLMIRHNTIFNSFVQTDAIGLFQDFGVVANVTIDDNLLSGGGYSIYGGEGRKGEPSNIVVINNRISSNFFNHGGYWGPATAFDAGTSGDIWEHNVWDGTDAIIPPP